MLYDLVSDVSETTYLSIAFPAIHDRLLRMLKEWREQVDGQIPEPNLGWKAVQPIH